jgi:hypothetical protein
MGTYDSEEHVPIVRIDSIVVLWNMTPYNLVCEHQCFRGMYGHHFEGVFRFSFLSYVIV